MKNVERRERSINAILAASLETLEEVGHARFRTLDVAKRSGMSEGTLFRYYPTKLELVKASLERTIDNHLERIVTEFAALPQPIDLEQLLWMFWRLLSHKEMLWTYELSSAASTDSDLRHAIAPILENHTKVADEFAGSVMNQLGMPESDVFKAFNLVTWTMQALILRDLGRGPSGDQERLIRYLKQVSMRVYGMTSHSADASVS
jgi:AcrR family transcriptional regulator